MSQREDFRRRYVSIIQNRYAGHFSIIQLNVKRALDEISQDPKQVAALVVGWSAYNALVAGNVHAVRLSIIIVKEGALAGGGHESTYHANRKTFERILERVLKDT